MEISEKIEAIHLEHMKIKMIETDFIGGIDVPEGKAKVILSRDKS